MTEKSTAATTAFCADRIVGPDARWLWIDGNQKITAGNGTYEDPAPNALSLVHVQDCPGATKSCKAACYVHGLKKHAPDTFALYQHNSKTIREILASSPRNIMNWKRRLGSWISQNAKGGFRWHVSGDVYSYEYAEFIRDTCRFSALVDHWIYTRSFGVDEFGRSIVGALMFNGNLQVMLSCDKDNYKEAYKEWRQGERVKYGTFRLAYLTRDGSVPEDLPLGSIIFPDYPLRNRNSDDPYESSWWCSLSPRQREMVCPVDFFGKSEEIRCGVCRRCFK
jgi:hypothetical protein